jgi:glutamyl-tRNA synthetase
MNISSSASVRVRFAPSPTGNLHIGGLRTALFNQLFARHLNGTFVLRIEDTDEARSKEEFTQAMLDALAWCGITSDEPLIFQSQRKDVYAQIVSDLITQKKMYRCICTQEEIYARAREKGNNTEHFIYDGYCRTKNITFDCGTSFVVRFALPENLTEIVVDDLILGKVVFSKDQFDDFILIRSDGTPTYNFAVVIDDNFMRISHVIRGQEHLGNTPKQILLYQACGYLIPKFAHIPLILSPNGGKLSKRDGAVDVLAYKKQGFLPDALVNYMVRLGWAYKDQEIFNRSELIEFFTLDGVGKKGGVFDSQKLEWVNSFYIKNLSPESILEWLEADVSPDLSSRCSSWNKKQLISMIALYKERVKTGSELVQTLINVHTGPLNLQTMVNEPWYSRDNLIHVLRLINDLERSDFTKKILTELIKAFITQHNLQLIAIAQPIRFALTGSINAPGLYDLLETIGKDQSLERLKKLKFIIAI